jgi:hypothetical protein
MKIQDIITENQQGVAEGIMKSLATRLVKGAANRQTPQEIANTHVRALNQRAPGTRMQGHPNFADFKREVHSYISAAQNGEQAFARTTDDHVKSLFKKYFSKGVSEGHADQQRTIVKRNGQPVGEIGIDRESSPGAGQYYMKHYASGTDLSGYSSREEALDELRHIMKQDVAKGKEK